MSASTSRPTDARATLTIAEAEALDTAVERLGRFLELLTALETSVNA